MRDLGGRRITRFVADHESCDGGFELDRRDPASGGGIVIACGGCGRSAECDPSHPGLLKLIEPERGKGPRRLTRKELERWLPTPPALPWWVPNAYIAAVIAIGLALIAFGATRGGDQPGTPGMPSQPIADIPAAGPAAVDAGTAGGAAEDGEEASAGWTFPEKALRRSGTLERVVLDRFAIGKPSSWGEGTAGGALVLFDPEGDGQLRVYFEAGERDLAELAGQARRFLASEHSGGQIGPPTRVRVGGSEAERAGCELRDGLGASPAAGRGRVLLSRPRSGRFDRSTCDQAGRPRRAGELPAVVIAARRSGCQRDL